MSNGRAANFSPALGARNRQFEIRYDALLLEQEGFTPCKGGRFTAEIVSKHRSEHQIRSGLGRLRRGDRPPGYMIIEMAQQLGIDPQWIYRGIAKGRIEISKDLRYGCYLFPRTKAVVTRMK